MIGLIVLLLVGVWLFASMKFAGLTAAGPKRPLVRALVAVLSFAAFAAFPFLDEIVGRWQFAHLCKAEAVVWIGPNAGAVVAVKDVGDVSDRAGLLFPVRQQSVKYADLSNGQVVYSATAFHTPGGALMRAGLGLGNSTSCWPEKWSEKMRGIDLDAKVKMGKQMQVLELYGTRLNELRSSTTNSSGWIWSTPESGPLVGASRAAVAAALGAPDACSRGAKDACMSARSWSYWFFRKSEGKPGLTPELQLQFGDSDTVESAKWSFLKRGDV